ncbi:hypothetical protein [Streptomyces sp. G-5]|uniref:hypothetical protein n=1 Tax=Streptomyces sp. G-5 TaxID=2977231 RepID=UPI0021D043E3|nr:hypothetical protein [Streptomyces sp. G-5]MCU4750275.1 hypothetical protein [Streptomyces sp. G-5]
MSLAHILSIGIVAILIALLLAYFNVIEKMDAALERARVWLLVRENQPHGWFYWLIIRPLMILLVIAYLVLDPIKGFRVIRKYIALKRNQD